MDRRRRQSRVEALRLPVPSAAGESFITQFAAGHGYTRYNARGTWSDDGSIFRFGTQSAKITTTAVAAQNCGGIKTNIAPTIDATGKSFRLYFRV